MASTYIIPPKGTKGVFSFKSPFDKTDKIGKNEELTVTSIRSLLELIRSNEDPYGTIYTPQGLTVDEYTSDLNSDIPVIVFVRSNGDFYYVPANRINSYPNITGHQYRRTLLAANLGSLPLNFNTDQLLEAVNEVILNNVGITTEAVIKPSGAITYVSDEDHNIFIKTLENKTTVDKSASILLLEANTIIDKQKKIIKNLEAALSMK